MSSKEAKLKAALEVYAKARAPAYEAYKKAIAQAYEAYEKAIKELEEK